MSIEPPVTAGRNGRSRVRADCLMRSGLESTGPARYAFSNFIDGGTLLRGFTIATAIATAVVCQTTLAQAQTPREPPPAWAYPVNPPDFKLPPDYQVASFLSGWSGVMVGTTCLLQISISLALDSRYEKGQLRSFFWMIWYPLAYWMFNMITTIVAVPRALARKTDKRARWISPDRGIPT